MRSGPDQRSRNRFHGSRPPQRQQGNPYRSQTFDSNGPGGVRIRGNASQIYERYITLAREAATSGDRITAENLYQHAEHYFRVDNARRVANQQGMPPRSTTPGDVEMDSSEPVSNEPQAERFQPQWDVHGSGFSET